MSMVHSSSRKIKAASKKQLLDPFIEEDGEAHNHGQSKYIMIQLIHLNNFTLEVLLTQ